MELFWVGLIFGLLLGVAGTFAACAAFIPLPGEGKDEDA